MNTHFLFEAVLMSGISSELRYRVVTTQNREPAFLLRCDDLFEDGREDVEEFKNWDLAAWGRSVILLWCPDHWVWPWVKKAIAGLFPRCSLHGSRWSRRYSKERRNKSDNIWRCFQSTEECTNLSLLELELGIKSVIRNP